jgi:hypothetical protein
MMNPFASHFRLEFSGRVAQTAIQQHDTIRLSAQLPDFIGNREVVLTFVSASQSVQPILVP